MTAASSPLLRVNGLRVQYEVGPGRTMLAVDDVSFDIDEGRTLALVGESGCGKSSVARAIMQLQPLWSGEVRVQDVELRGLAPKALKRMRRRFQMIFQDPISSLNPRRRVRDLLRSPLVINDLYRKGESERRIESVLAQVGLDSEAVLDRYPHEFSGGQCQRLSIARALLLDPVLLVCDEPVSALDVSVRAQVLNVLHALRADRKLTMLFISHDLAVVRNVADEIAVMYLGKIVEIGKAEALIAAPAHPYTAALISAVPIPDPEQRPSRIPLKGEMPSPMASVSGCRFRTRCPAAQPLCASEAPLLRATDDATRRVACHFPFSVTLPHSPSTVSPTSSGDHP